VKLAKLGVYSKIDIYRRKLLLAKIWFIVNSFLFLPFTSWFFFVFLAAFVDPTKSIALNAWLQIWGIIVLISQIIFCWFLFIRIDQIRHRIDNIESSMESR